MNSRIRTPFHILFLNPGYVAARSLRSLRSNNEECTADAVTALCDEPVTAVSSSCADMLISNGQQ